MSGAGMRPGPGNRRGREAAGEVLRGLVSACRWTFSKRLGTDLLEALVALDRAVSRDRDINPANLGVREGRAIGPSTGAVLFLPVARRRHGGDRGHAALPGSVTRRSCRWRGNDLSGAGERQLARWLCCSAETATGATPRSGYGLSDPASVHDEATIETRMFDSAVAGPARAVSLHRAGLNAGNGTTPPHRCCPPGGRCSSPFPGRSPATPRISAATAEPSTLLTMAGLSAGAPSRPWSRTGW